MRATRWHCCGAVAFSCFWEVPRYGDVMRHSAEERPIKHSVVGYLLLCIEEIFISLDEHRGSKASQGNWLMISFTFLYPLCTKGIFHKVTHN